MLQKPESNSLTMDSKELSSLGIEEVAYVKTIRTPEWDTLYAIHAADGTRLTVVSDRNLAFATVSQYDLMPMSVH